MMRQLLFILSLFFAIAGTSQPGMLLVGQSGGQSQLLNEYPGAWAAYSFRLLDGTYTGPAVEVRRSSDDEILDIGFVNGELDQPTLAAFCVSTDCFVRTWYDQSGAGRDVTQTTDADQPKIVSSGTIVTENGLPALEWDGSTDYLQASVINNSDEGFVFVVGNGSPVVSQSNPFLGGLLFVLFPSPNASHNKSIRVVTRNGESDPVHNIYGDSLAYNVHRIFTWSSDASTYEFWVDGVAQTETVASGSNNGRWFSLQSYDFTVGASVDGTPTWGSGTMQEVIVYNSDQTSTHADIETNMLNYYKP